MPPEEVLVKESSYEESIRKDERKKCMKRLSNIVRNKNQN